MDPFIITYNGRPLEGWLDASLERKRDSVTSALEFSVFFSNMPSAPVLTDLMPGAGIQVYIAGELAFNGTVDSRGGASVTRDANGRGHDKTTGQFLSRADDGGSDNSRSVNISKDAYRIVFSCRGTCKRLADSSHNHDTGYLEKAKPIDAIKALIKGHNVDVIDDAKLSDEIPRWFGDGGLIFDEIHRILKFSGASLFETPKGELKIANHGESGNGDDLILGQNILSFSANVTEEFQRSIIRIKGARTNKSYGRKSIVDPVQELEVQSVKTFAPYVGQIDGDATPERLKSAAKNEAANRSQNAKSITITVFHVQSQSGAPWEINTTHYVEIPPENIFDEFVTTAIRYQCDGPSATLTTNLTMSPKASVNEDGSGDSANSDNTSKGQTRRSKSGINTASPWTNDVSFSSGVDYKSAVNNSGSQPSMTNYPPTSISAK